MPRKLPRSGYWTYLYFVQSAAFPHLVKIGHSSRPAARIEHLKLVCPVLLIPIYLVKAHQMAHEILHVAFADQREHGEWFRPHANLKRLVRAWKTAKVELLTPDVMAASLEELATAEGGTGEKTRLFEYLREYRAVFQADGMGGASQTPKRSALASPGTLVVKSV